MNSWFASLDDRLNPILVKEIRQSLRGRSTLLVIGAALLVQLFALYLFAVNSTVEEPGARFFSVISVVFQIGSFILIAVFCQRFSLEKRDDDLDFTYITTLSPWRIVGGKFVSALVMEVMLFSLCLPFMVMSYYLGGIDLSTILLRSVMLLVIMLPCIMLGLLIGSSGKKGSVVLFVVIFIFISGLITAALGEISNFNDLPTVLAVAFFVLGFLGMLTVAAVGNINSNRAAGLRIFLTASALAAFPILNAIISTHKFKPEVYAVEYFGWWIGFAVLLLLISAVEPGMPSRRVMAEIRSSSTVIYWVKRLFSGSAVSGFLLGLLLLTGGCLGLYWSNHGGSPEAMYMPVGIGCYVVFYAGFTIFLNRLIEHWTLRFSGIGCLIATGLLFCAIPGLVSSLFRQNMDHLARPPWEMWASVFSLNFRDSMFAYHVSIWLALAGILLALPSVIVYFRLKKS